MIDNEIDIKLIEHIESINDKIVSGKIDSITLGKEAQHIQSFYKNLIKAK